LRPGPWGYSGIGEIRKNHKDIVNISWKSERKNSKMFLKQRECFILGQMLTKES
jgi:hypothetical protein